MSVARDKPLLHRVAQHLGLTFVAACSGGEFGAAFVRDSDGRDLVLKVMPGTALAARFARGAGIAMKLRERGYPAPAYFGTGTALGASWSLQERLRGDVPDAPTPPHIRRLVEMAHLHAGAAVGIDAEPPPPIPDVNLWLLAAYRNERTHALAVELRGVLERTAGEPLLHESVVHRDFHHRNYLAIGDEVTGVFDWELSGTGDWRFDVVTLAFWCALLTDAIPRAAAQVAIDAAHDICPPTLLARFAAHMALRQIDYDIRTHPEFLDGLLKGIDERIAPWWRQLR
jgi:aminoglycoside phosphotransferase (APT) family kinase protein